MSTTICIAEDRLSEEVAVKLLVLSLQKHCPNVRVVLTFPPADRDFKAWIAQFPQVELRTTKVPGAYGWNVKPQALLTLLKEGYDQVWWLDSDVILTCDFFRKLKNISPTTFIASEEALYGGGYRDGGRRAAGWGFTVDRVLPFTLNSGVMRATPAHVPLLKRWKQLLEGELYKQAQQGLWSDRPLHLVGDQDVLTALLSSHEFASIPLRFLYRGRDIIQYFGPSGYTLRERLIHLIFGLPPFIHAQGHKPWRTSLHHTKNSLRARYDALWLEVSPYSHVAAQYQNRLGEDLSWADPVSAMGTFLKGLGFGNPALTGLPLALIYSLTSLLKLMRQAVRGDSKNPSASATVPLVPAEENLRV